MLRNYLKVALRNLFRFKGYSSINILGLAMGVACCLLILQFLRDELSYDAHHEDAGQLYRVTTDFIQGDDISTTGTTPGPLAKAIQADFPEVETSVRVYRAPGVEKFLLKFDDRSFFEERVVFADSSMFELFNYPFYAGDPTTALQEPNTVVLAKELASKVVGNDPIGKTIKVETLYGAEEYKITGTFDNDAFKSHIDANMIVASNSGAIGRRWYYATEWGGNNLFYTYVKLAPGANSEALVAKLPEWLDGYAGRRLQELGFGKRHDLELVKNIYLESDVMMPIGPAGNIDYLYLLGIVAIFVLVIACINFMNLATAKATVRGHEVGVRKAIGASRESLIQQFFSEAVMYSILAVALGLVIAHVVLPGFNTLTGKEIGFDLTGDRTLVMWLTGLVVLTSVVAGSYPALYLSSFNPSKIFRGQLGANGLSAGNVRKGLVLVQFVVSIALIQGVIVINKQLGYCNSKSLGFDPTAKLILPLNTTASANTYEAMKNELLRSPGFEKVGITSSYPGGGNIEDMIFVGEGQSPDEGGHAFRHYVDPDYLEMMKFKLVGGRMFSEGRFADTVFSAVISETLASRLDYTPESAIGKTMGFNWFGEQTQYTIIGVIKDFHSRSLHFPLDGEVFFWDPNNPYGYMIAEVATDRIEETVATAQAVWSRFNPDDPFEHFFMDDKLQQNYLASRRVGGLITWGTILAIVISCLGLLGLASFAAERRKKEFGVRRLLGANGNNILRLMSNEFLRLVMAAIVIASPLAYLVLTKWLGGFEFHVSIPWWTYVLGGLAAVVIVLVTVSVQTWRTLNANPVDSLRSE